MFDLQLFNDTLKTGFDLKINWSFADGDSRLSTLPNPASSLTSAILENFVDNVISSECVVGDATGANLSGVVQIYTEQTTKNILDLS